MGGGEDMAGTGPLRQEGHMAQSPERLLPCRPPCWLWGEGVPPTMSPNASCEPGTTTGEPASSAATGLSTVGRQAASSANLGTKG